MAKVRPLSDAQFLQLLKIAAGLLQQTQGDLREALSLAMVKHADLIQAIREPGLATDLGPGNAILFVPPEGGMALRLERHAPSGIEDMLPTEEAPYPEIDLLGDRKSVV